MERFTKKNEFFEYVLPEQNIFGDNQAFEISVSENEYTCKLHITGEAIKRFGELEDVLEKYNIENIGDLELRLEDIEHYAYQENKQLVDILAKYGIDNLDDFIKEYSSRNIKLANNNYDLEQELAELKQKVIVPKFKVGQEIYVIDDYFRVTSAIIERVIINTEHSISEGETSYVHYLANLGEKYEWDERYLMLDGEDISLTKEEAEQKLAEIKGE